MKRDYNRLHFGSITVRFPMALLEELDTKYGAGLKYRDRSDVIRSLIVLALRVESLLEIQRDPKKKQEFEEKFTSLLKEKDIEKSLETMDDNQLRGVAFFIENLKNKKVQLLLDDIRKS